MQTYSFLVPMRVRDGTATLILDEKFLIQYFLSVNEAKKFVERENEKRHKFAGEECEIRRAVLMVDDEVYDESAAREIRQ